MKKVISVCIALLFALSALLPAAADVIYLYPSETLPEDTLRVTAHRGLSELAPENTLPAYRLAGEYGFLGRGMRYFTNRRRHMGFDAR